MGCVCRSGRQRGERRRRRRQPGRGRKTIGAAHLRAAAQAGTRAHEVEELLHAGTGGAIFGAAVQDEHTVAGILFEADLGARDQAVERERQRRYGRQILGDVAFAPVLDEGNVGARLRYAEHGILTVNPSNPAARQAPSTVSSRPGASAIAAPPPPAPVSLAPSAPAARASAHRRSNSGELTPSFPSSSWFSSRRAPVMRVRPAATSSPMRRRTSCEFSTFWATRATIARVSRGFPLRPIHSSKGASVTGCQPCLRE